MITQEEVQKVLQKAAKRTLKDDGVHIEIVFKKQAEAIVKLFALPVVTICVCGSEEYAENKTRLDGMVYCGKCHKPF